MSLALLRIVLLSYVLFGAVLYLRQDALLYFPDQTPFADCEELSAAQRLDMNGTRGYFFQNGTSTKLAVLYHGNAGRACDRAFYQTALTHAGYSWLMVEYRGYAGAGEKPSTKGILEDTRRVTAWVNEKKFSHIAVIGESIGAGPASYHAYIGGTDKLVLITPFEKLGAVAGDYYPIYPIALLLRDDFDNSAWARSAQHVFIVYGAKDTIIPAKHAIGLFDALPQENKQLLEINSDHNDVPAFGETQIAIRDFLMEENKIDP